MTRESTNDGAASGGVPEAGAPPSRRGWPIFERERERERETPIAYLARSPSVSKCDCSSQGCRLHVLPKTLSSQVTLSFFCRNISHAWVLACALQGEDGVTVVGCGCFFKGLNFYFRNPWKYICLVKVDLFRQNMGFNLKFEIHFEGKTHCPTYISVSWFHLVFKHTYSQMHIMWSLETHAVFWLWR